MVTRSRRLFKRRCRRIAVADLQRQSLVGGLDDVRDAGYFGFCGHRFLGDGLNTSRTRNLSWNKLGRAQLPDNWWIAFGASCSESYANLSQSFARVWTNGSKGSQEIVAVADCERVAQFELSGIHKRLLPLEGFRQPCPNARDGLAPRHRPHQLVLSSLNPQYLFIDKCKTLAMHDG
jgi:hypothetical protein